MRSIAGFLLLASMLAPAIQADPLDDVRAKLKTLQAGTDLKGVLDARYEEFDEKGQSDPAKSAHLQFDVEADGGLSIHLSPSLVQALAEEESRNSADPDQPQPLADLQREMSPSHLRHMLSAAETIQVLVSGAASPVTKAAVLDGVSVTEVSMELPAKLPKNQSGNVKDWKDDLTLWLDADGVPVQLEDKVHGKFCKFFFCATFDEDHMASFKVFNGRLIAVKETVEHKQSGFGFDSDTKTVASLQLQ